MPISTRDILNDERRQFFAYNASNLIEYIGRAHPSAKTSDSAWQIRKFTYNASNLQTRTDFANGTSDFDKVWNDRTTYDYDPDS